MALIYILIFPNGQSYIGRTIQALSKRMGQHNHDATSKRKNSLLSNAILLFGLPKPEVLLYCEPKDAATYERLLVQLHGTQAPAGYNTTPGGEGLLVQAQRKRKRLDRRNELARARYYAAITMLRSFG